MFIFWELQLLILLQLMIKLTVITYALAYLYNLNLYEATLT